MAVVPKKSRAEQGAQVSYSMGIGVIWNGMPFETTVIPAQAGIQSVGSAFPRVCGIDSRLRGNDRTRDCLCLANAASATR
jgi:hypothetical protein